MNKKNLAKRVAIGDMVYLTDTREGIIRFKGKTGFGLGEWFGVEIRTEHKTRHDGLIHGKRYFRCPRNKGLFVRRPIIVDVMDKRTAEQKTRVFKMGGRTARRLNKKIHRKHKQSKQTQTAITETAKKKTKKKGPKTDKKPKKEKEKDKPKQKQRTSSIILSKQGDDTKYIKLSDVKPLVVISDHDQDRIDKDDDGVRKDFGSKESFSNPKSRHYFGKDQVFTGLDRRRSRYEDILLMDPVAALVVQDTTKPITELGTKRRKKKKKIKHRDNDEDSKPKKQKKKARFKDDTEETPQHIVINSYTNGTNHRNDRNDSVEEEIHSEASLSPQYSPFMVPDSSPAPSPEPSPSPKALNKKYRPFGGDAEPKQNQLAAPMHIKQISMEFTKGNLKAKLKKVTITKRKKRNGTIGNVYDKYSAKADYPVLDDLRNETLVSEFLSFDLYNAYRGEKNIMNDYTIDRAITCGCFYLPDPIGFRLGHFKTYEVFQDLCDELLCILHDEWNPKDRPHKKNTDWRVLMPMSNASNTSIDMDNANKSMLIKRRRSPMIKVKKGRHRGNSSVDARPVPRGIREKRRKSKRKTQDMNTLAEDAEMNIMSSDIELPTAKLPTASTAMARSDSASTIQLETKSNDPTGQDQPTKKEKRRRSRKRIRNSAHGKILSGVSHGIHVRSSLQNSSFMMTRLSLWDNEYVSSCRITLSRNLHGFRFSNVISRSERRNLEKILSQCLSQCNDGSLKGRYRPYSKINKRKIPLLIETDKLFPKPDAPALIMAGYTRDWPESRGIFINSNKNLYIWCNYLEHLHLISVQNDGNILIAFKRLFDSEQKLESLIKQRQEVYLANYRLRQQEILQRESQHANASKSPKYIDKDTEQMLVAETPTQGEDTVAFKDLSKKTDKEKEKEKKTSNRALRLTKQEYRIKKTNFDELQTGFVYDDELGYISSNPQYFGTSMRVYVTVKLPNLIKHEKFNDILEIRNLTAYQHDVDSAQQMFMAYASQLPSKTEVTQIKERRNSLSNPQMKVSKQPKVGKLSTIATSSTEHNEFKELSAAATNTKPKANKKAKTKSKGKAKKVNNRRSSNPGIATKYKKKPSSKQNRKSVSIIPDASDKKKKRKKDKKGKQEQETAESDFMLNLNLPNIGTSNSLNLSIEDNKDFNEPKVSLKAFKSVPLPPNDDTAQPIKDDDKENVLIHDDEDLGDVVDPTHYKEEITIYQTISLGVSEVEQVQAMIDAINYLIEFEKLLSGGKSLGERLNAERIKKANLKKSN